MTEVERENLLRCKEYIVKTLNPAYVLSYMKTWLSDETVEQIQEESNRPTKAAELFLQSILQLNVDGWFRGFLDALKASDYTGLHDAIDKWDFKIIESLEPHRQLLKRIEPAMQDIDVKEIQVHMKECLRIQEWEEICKISERKGRQASASKLIECLCRSDKEQWPKTFQIALHDSGYNKLTKLWDLKGADNADVEMADEDEDSCVFEIQISEEAESDNLCENSCSPSDAFQQPRYVLRKPRSYQIELAEPALKGKHTMICAPTGSGKTFVSIMICEHHLRNRPIGQKGKVVFLATKVPVYEQQKKVFCEYFKNDYKVAGICGENAYKSPAEIVIKQNDIIIMTPQTLLNSLTNETVLSLSIFTLMIFDECHNTTGSNPYNMLMSKYLDLKLKQGAVLLPQIVGLTASPGIGNAKNVGEAIDYICNICASLNIEVISTVRKNIKDLEEIVPKPEKIIKLVGTRPQNRFVDIVSQMMSKAEDLARQFHPIDNMSVMKNQCYGTQKYEQWIVDVQKKAVVLQLPNKEEESRVCRALFICTQHLRKYNDALIINEDARTKDALIYLKDYFEDTKNGNFDNIEQHLASNFEVNLPELTAASEDESNENPKLEDITEILGEVYHVNPETRTILFVKTRALLAALKNWIEETPELKHLKPQALMGRGKRNHCTGMTLPNQKGTLDAFQTNGDSKLLIATSVADEGIDIAECNLILLYEYIGNVIKMIQVRGRGRAKDSKCILVTSKKEQEEKERYNLEKEQMMNRAIEEVQSWDEKIFAQKINVFQKQLIKMLDSKKKPTESKPWKNNRVLLCGKCKNQACSTEDLRVIEDSHHTVLGEKFKTRYITEPHKKARNYGNFEKKFKMYCTNCHHDWGIVVKYKTFNNMPIIKIESFSVHDVVSNKQIHFGKWKDVDFAMKDFDIEEMSE
ncbi:antiviral innate immune response receptor RIG-I [Crotalus tigris]|uniref:antiviral innate immune response receptor RIG-I n=1 Tax=Crotalus tigris TaxID=88082 RepID=UPI00192F2916|nr:antiviral innate immune response receptor RIG-I [Crotalus tigris]XP_039204557.1 antiviral innate immune response receptor RIG-I [Crotalus tigris]